MLSKTYTCVKCNLIFPIPREGTLCPFCGADVTKQVCHATMPTPQTPTPETDAEHDRLISDKGYSTWGAFACLNNFARKLERERDVARRNNLTEIIQQMYLDEKMHRNIAEAELIQLRKQVFDWPKLSPLERRFWSNVTKLGKENPEIGRCWEWLAAKNRYGYGVFWMNKKQMAASRAVWFIHYKSDPKRLHVLHKCDNPICCNPDHLFLGTPRHNARDREAKNRGNRTQSNKGKFTNSTLPHVKAKGQP